MKQLILTESQYKRLLSEITSEEIMAETENVNLNPTDSQKEAGNYRMGHISVKGMKIAIENPIGSRRYYTDEKTGERKYTEMKNHYGYFNITKGKDGDAVDVFIGPDIENFDKVYCVDQKNKKGEFDETKVMLGFSSKEQAKQAYFDNFSPDWKGFMYITGVPLNVFKKWLYRGRKQRQPFAKYVYIKKKQLKEGKENSQFQQPSFRVKYELKKENPNANKYANKWGYVDDINRYTITTEIKEFNSIEEAKNFFNELRSTYAKPNNGSAVLSIVLQKLKSTLVGEQWCDLKHSSYNDYLNITNKGE